MVGEPRIELGAVHCLDPPCSTIGDTSERLQPPPQNATSTLAIQHSSCTRSTNLTAP